MTEIKPKVFIGSSRESIDYVTAIQEELSHYAQVTPWSAGAFHAQEYPMESLERQLEENDFAVFVFSPDDILNIRGKTTFTMRDNTLFEMGLFWGRLKRGRIFYIVANKTPQNDEVEGFRLPSDLEGLTVLKYEIRNDSNFNAAVNVACGAIKRKINQLGVYQDPAKLLAEAEIKTEKDYAIIRLLRKLSKRLLTDPSKRYEYLYEAVWNAYQVPRTYSVEGVGIWKREGNDGLRQIAGNEGQGKFYEFNVNDNKEAEERIIVIDCLLNSEELVLFKNKTSFDNTYVLCYPIDNQLVITVAITGRIELSENDFDQVFLDNHDLLDTINNLFGGVST